ncbi:serine-protein kinase ATM isoform X5 [Homalodisca vitripennis]|uniref:serine-protein kinase ATM isoform X5 n=1 Tax=Homalodisca vitripennis TaxID=197043 RepID=UPI001EE9CB45|nr:serine-protein kinase ATM isoform X5 [Homalodisca vitripennis]
MEQLQNEIRICCNLLDSNKITERKKKSSDLLEYLQRKEILTLLNKNSENKEEITWDTVLLATHRGLLKESDRIRNEELKGCNQASKLEGTKVTFCSLISTIAARANSGGIQRLTVGSLLQCVFSVLQEVFLRKHFGYTYLQVLRYQILTTHNYCMNIGEELWKDLFQLLQQLYRNPPPKVDKAVIIGTLNFIIKNGSCHSFFALDVKKMFPTLCEWIKADIRTLNLQEHLVQLALTVCRVLQFECRMAICKFGEDVMSDFRNIYDHRADGVSKKKDLLLDWFVLQVRVHHPGGAQRGSDAAHAGQWDVWTRQLGWMYQLVIAEVKAVQRHRTIRHLRPSFVTLAVAVCKQIFVIDSREMLDMSMISNLNDTSMMEGNPTKRIKLETGVQAILDKLVMTQQQDMWPWLSLLSALSNKHPELIGETDVTSLLQFCAEQLQTCKDNTTMESLYRCCNALLYVEIKKDSNLLDTNKLIELWSSIWETCLRTIGLNLCEEWSHLLVQQLILDTKQVPVDKLLELYISGAIHRSRHSMDTLRCLSTTFCLTERLSAKQCKILQEWILPSREESIQDDWNSLLPCTDLIAKLLLALSIKNKLYEVTNNSPVSSMDDFEKHYITTSFEDGLLVERKCAKPTSTEDAPKQLVLQDNELLEHMLTVLTREHFVTKEKSTPGTSAAVHMFTVHSGLLFHVITMAQQWGLSLDDRLETYLYESCNAVAAAVESVLTRKTEIPVITGVLERLVSLFQLFSTNDIPICRNLVKRLGTDYIIQACSKLTVVSQRTHQPTSDFDFDEMDTASPVNSDETSPFDKESIFGWSQVQLQAYRVMLEYWKWGSGDLMSRWLKLPVSNNKDISSSCALQMAFNAAKLVCSMPSVEEDVLEELLNTLQSLCRKWHASDIAIIAIINIFKDMCHHIHRSEDCQANYIVLITGVLKFVKKRKYGPHVSTQFVELLGLIAVVDKAANWSTRVTDDGSVRPLAHELLFFITSPFYQVRIAACRMIWTLFSTSCQQQIFNDLLAAVNEIFLIQGDLLVDEELDEGVSRTATALHCLSVISVFTSKWRCKALFNIFYITVQKNLNTVLVKKVLTTIAKHEDIEQLSEFIQPALPLILWHWHEKSNSLQSFPWALLGYTSDAQFYSAQLQVILPVLIYRRDSTSLQHIAAVTGQPISVLIEASYSQLLGSVLPRFADDNQQETATVIISTIEQYLGDEKVKSLLVAKMTDVIACVISNLHDPENCKSLFGGELPELPECTKLMFPAKLVLGGIQYIQLFQENSPNSDVPLWIYLSQEKPRLIQKVLLKLYTKVQKAKLMEFKLLFLHHFVTLCDMLVAVVAKPRYHLSRYTVYWITRVLLHLAPGDMGMATVCYLHRFLSTVLSSHPQLVDSLLPRITTTLVPLASRTSPVGKKVLEVLELLLVTHANTLVTVATLEPLPSDPMFATMSEKYQKQRYATPLSTSLHAEIQHVLNTSQHGTAYHEGLSHLRRKLSENKVELADLYKDLQNSRGFSEDCEQSILHQLICLLIQITSGSDPKASYEAACCLGEFGPADLTTLGLKPETSASSTQPQDVFLECVVRHLYLCLFDSDVAVIQAASDALYSLFNSFHHQLTNMLTEEQSELFYPFVSSAKKQKKLVSVNERELEDLMSMFCPDEVFSHRQWVIRIMSAILHSAQLGYLTPVCNFKEDFCNELFPMAIDLVLSTLKKRSCTDLFIDQINEFFARHANTDSSVEVYGSRDSVCTMLKVVHVVRKYTEQQRKINYLSISRAAIFCSAYFTAVMYGELWASEYNSDRGDLDVEGLTQLEYIEEKDCENGQILQNLLREAYTKIGEPDAVYGCGNSHLRDWQTQILHYQYEGRWRSVVEACDMQLALDPTLQLQGLQNALHHCGLYHLAGRVSERQNYEASWRLGQWELVEPETHSHDSLVYCGLRSLRGGDTARALQAVRQARSLVIQGLAHTSLEAATNVYTPLAKLRSLQEIEDFATLDFMSVAKKWEEQDKIGWKKFTQFESILAQRITMLRIRENLNPETCAKVMLRATEAAREEGLFTVAHSWLMSLSHLRELSPLQSLSIQLLQAQLYWDKQEADTARYHLRRLLGHLKDTELSALYARALQTYGAWVAHTRTEHAQQILDKYLIPAVDISDNEFRLVSAFTLARYADSEYQTLLNYIKSSVYTSKMKSISESLTSAQKLSKAVEVTKKSTDIDRQTRIDLQKSINMHDKQSKIDQTEVENAQKELDNFLILAIRHYMMSLEIGESDNLSIFRVVSLWLNNNEHDELQEELSRHINKVPTFKVLPVLPQLVARITENTGELSMSLLHNLIERCAKDHPHHVLPLLLALANSYKDQDYCQSSLQGVSKPETRVVAAQHMLNKMKQKTNLKTLIRDMQVVSEAYISLANFPHTPDKSCKVFKIPKSEPITKLKSMEHILCPTATLAVQLNKCSC